MPQGLSGVSLTPFVEMVEALISANPGLRSMSIRKRFCDVQTADRFGAGKIRNGTSNS
jgi:hypothetical protein